MRAMAAERLAYDRAAVVARTIIQLVARNDAELYAHLAAYLRDEFSDIERQTINDIHIT